jgi:hypothetical protein
MTNRKSMPTGPSDQYIQLLKGEIAPANYVSSVKKRVDARSGLTAKRSVVTGAFRTARLKKD